MLSFMTPDCHCFFISLWTWLRSCKWVKLSFIVPQPKINCNHFKKCNNLLESDQSRTLLKVYSLKVWCMISPRDCISLLCPWIDLAALNQQWVKSYLSWLQSIIQAKASNVWVRTWDTHTIKQLDCKCAVLVLNVIWQQKFTVWLKNACTLSLTNPLYPGEVSHLRYFCCWHLLQH